MRKLIRYLVAYTALVHVGHAASAGWLLHPIAGLLGPVGAVLVAGFSVYLLRGRVAFIHWDRPISAPRRAAEELYYIHWTATLLTPLAAGVAMLLRPLPEAWLVGYASAWPIALWAVALRPRWERVRHVDVAIADLPPALDGYRIVQLSDLHIGSLCPPGRAERWIRRANALSPDLIALTGDYVTSGVSFHADIARTLAGLTAPDGVVAIMGNHDYYGDGEPLLTLLAAADVTVLRNSWCTRTRGDAELHVAGIDDRYTQRADVAATFAERPDISDRATTLVLAHDPVLFPTIAEHGPALVLSGHTHWGQIALPFAPQRLNVAGLRYRFHAGLGRIDGSQIYVSPGLGMTGAPLRFGAAPEITAITLRAAQC